MKTPTVAPGAKVRAFYLNENTDGLFDVYIVGAGNVGRVAAPTLDAALTSVAEILSGIARGNFALALPKLPLTRPEFLRAIVVPAGIFNSLAREAAAVTAASESEKYPAVSSSVEAFTVGSDSSGPYVFYGRARRVAPK